MEQLGEEFGQLLCAYLAYIRRETGAAFRGDLMQLTIQMELFVEIYNRFEAGEEKMSRRNQRCSRICTGFP